LAALPPASRFNAEGYLKNLQLQACADFPAMAFAAKYVRKLANEIWFRSPVSVALMAATADPTERLYDKQRGTALPLAATEHLLDALADPLADGVAGMARRAAVDRVRRTSPRLLTTPLTAMCGVTVRSRRSWTKAVTS
jgi:hypothetical protein